MNLVRDSSPASIVKLLIDAKYPTKTQQDEFTEEVGRYIEAVKLAFKAMVNQANWLNEKSKKAIYKKLDKMKVSCFLKNVEHIVNVLVCGMITKNI